MSKIEWTGKTWNPLSGCSRKSDGCKNCYAEVMTKRLAAMGQEKYKGLLNEQGRFNGVMKFDEKALLIPLKTKKPTVWFVNSMSDLFHENVKDEWIDKAFAVMALCPQHTFQILTKRPERMRDYFANLEERELEINCELYELTPKPVPHIPFIVGVDLPLPNVWLGVSVENQQTADERIPLLLETPAAIRFLSCEPLLGEIILNRATQKYYEKIPLHKPVDYVEIDWVIVGGESGNRARPCSIEWIRDIVRQCQNAKVPVFVKQLGKRSFQSPKSEGSTGYFLALENKKGGDISEFPEDLQIREFPKVF